MRSDAATGAPVRLPAAVRPTAYDLRLAPDLQAFTFSGSAEIEIEVLSPTRSVTLNAIELEIGDAWVRPRGGGPVAGAVTLDAASETATITLGAELAPGPATLGLSFSGILNDRLRGFYRSRYVGADGRERHLASTQFEATDARRAFPCWDEPALKATFSVTLVVPGHMAAVSNMPERSSSLDGGLRAVRFETTPPMSTYLLGFAVGDMTCIEERSGSGTLMRVWATTGNEERGRFALDVSLRLLDYFNDYFGIPYPLPKLDHLAIPDFAAGAMENWGCITYREPALLVDEGSSSAGTRQLVAEIVAHEMAHMWFGDLVTMEWWNDLWLNESFASWMGDKAVDALFPEWDKWDQFLVDETARAMRLDGLRSSHPIEQAVDDPAEIGQLFDAISYSKGAAVIRMLEAHLGERRFRDGIRLYLERHIHSNATTRDLWDALAAASGQPVAQIMDSWTSQTGYPYLSVDIDRPAGAARVTATQRRFAYEAVLGGDEDDPTLWQIPVSVASAAGAAASTLLPDRAGEVTVEGSGGGWVKVNPGHTGFFRVRYPPAELALLAGAVDEGELPAADRLGLADDAFALCRAGMLPAEGFLDLAGRYGREESQPVWATLTSHLAGLDSLLEGEEFHGAFRAWARGLLGPATARVGWTPAPGEGHLAALMRGDLLLAAGRFGDPGALGEARARFERCGLDPSAIEADLRRAVFVLAAMGGGRAEYEAMWEMHGAAGLQEEKVRLLTALTQFPSPELVAETLERSFGERVRAHEAIGVIVRTAATAMGRDLAWRFMRENWDEVDRRYGEGGFGLMYLVEITAGFTKAERLEEVERFFADHPTPAAERTIRQCTEKIRLNIAWLERNRAGLAARLAPA